MGRHGTMAWDRYLEILAVVSEALFSHFVQGFHGWHGGRVYTEQSG